MSMRKILVVSFVSLAIACSSSPAPVLTVTPPSATVAAGGPAETFTATLTHAQGNIAWTLTGDGSLSAETGSTTSYTPPASIAGSETATLTASAAGVTATVDITINLPGPALTTRTVASKLQTQFTKDDGTSTIVPGWSTELEATTVTALLVPDASAAGYTSFPVTVAADGTFSVANVPTGAYFIQIDQHFKVVHVSAVQRTLYPATSDTPDLTLFVHGRSDRAGATAGTVLHLDVTGLTALPDPATIKFPASLVRLTSAQAPAVNLGLQNFITPKPQPGDTSLNGSFSYTIATASYLPDASKGDVTYLYEETDREPGTGSTAASYRFVSSYLRSDSLTLVAGTGGTLSGAMVAAPQTGSVSGNLALSQFAALASAIHPTGQPSATTGPTFGVFALTHALPLIEHIPPVTPLAALAMGPQSADVDYGTLTYGRLPESSWSEYVQFLYSYDLTLPAPAGAASVPATDFYVKNVLVSSAPGSFAPALSPPRSPRLNGTDAQQALTGTGSAPLVSWLPPATGTPGAYVVSVSVVDANDVQEEEVFAVNAVGLTGTSFKIPPGSLTAGRTYLGGVTAQSGSLNPAGSPILQNALVEDSVSTDFGVFAP